MWEGWCEKMSNETAYEKHGWRRTDKNIARKCLGSMGQTEDVRMFYGALNNDHNVNNKEYNLGHFFSFCNRKPIIHLGTINGL